MADKVPVVGEQPRVLPMRASLRLSECPHNMAPGFTQSRQSMRKRAGDVALYESVSEDTNHHFTTEASPRSSGENQPSPSAGRASKGLRTVFLFCFVLAHSSACKILVP